MLRSKHKKYSKKDIASSKQAISERRGAILVLVFCAIAAIRVLVFSAAFPFFGNVDEQAHFDLCLKYVRGIVPRGLYDYSPESARLIVLYGSPEYLRRIESGSRGSWPPIWSLPPDVQRLAMSVQLRSWLGEANHESTQPPVYYALAAAWWRLGEGIGLRGGRLLYWLRFMNVPIYALLVWFSYFFTKRFEAENRFLWLGVPCLLSFFPQDVFYTINNDVLSPLLFAVALYLLLELCMSADRHAAFYLLAGVAVATAFLVKFSNFAILAGFLIVLFLQVLRARRLGMLRRYLPRLIIMFLAAAIPVGLWLGRNYYVVGDLTGSGPKIRLLGWTPKEIAQIWNHPIFTPRGALYFCSDLMKTFWRGELVWMTERLASPVADAVYWVSSAIFITAMVISLLLLVRKQPARELQVDLFNLAMLGLSVGLLVGISVLYDFGECWYPSRENPYLTSGRLISGMLVPFVVFYLKGLDRLLTAMRLPQMRWPLLLIIVGIATVSEILLTIPVFGSAFNWYHLQ